MKVIGFWLKKMLSLKEKQCNSFCGFLASFGVFSGEFSRCSFLTQCIHKTLGSMYRCTVFYSDVLPGSLTAMVHISRVSQEMAAPCGIVYYEFLAAITMYIIC
jgi:hypothetical protein